MKNIEGKNKQVLELVAKKTEDVQKDWMKNFGGINTVVPVSTKNRLRSTEAKTSRLSEEVIASMNYAQSEIVCQLEKLWNWVISVNPEP